ncbi:MAG TPA: hypothetical protein VGM82_03495 [Gemmatimonadaceae bacterium]|jgi:hypothetical protein
MHEFLLPVGLLDASPPSWYTLIGPPLRSSAYDGVPHPAPDGAAPRILVLEPGGASDAFLAEYAEDFGYITDSWFATREAAVADADQRFGDLLGTWMPIPETESHPETFALRAVSPVTEHR